MKSILSTCAILVLITPVAGCLVPGLSSGSLKDGDTVLHPAEEIDEDSSSLGDHDEAADEDSPPLENAEEDLDEDSSSLGDHDEDEDDRVPVLEGHLTFPLGGDE